MMGFRSSAGMTSIRLRGLAWPTEKAKLRGMFSLMSFLRPAK